MRLPGSFNGRRDSAIDQFHLPIALLMAYADESPLVGLNYIRAAATNLALEAGAYTHRHVAASNTTPRSTSGEQPGR